jgi:hypothetical protein
MEEQNSIRYLCKYIVKNLVIKKEDEKIELDHSHVMNIEYLCDYDFNLMALLKVVLRIDIRKKLWILKNKKDITVKFELVKIGMDIDSGETVTSEEECINQEFGVHFNDDDDATDVKLLEERLKQNEGEEFNLDEIEDESYFESQNNIDLYLFHPKLLKSSRINFQRIYEESTLQNIVAEMLTDTKHVDVIMSKFENDEIYKEFILPANPVYKNLAYIDQYYGMYRKGALIFYDIDALYILNLNGEVTAKREEEWTETYIRVPTTDKSIPGNGMERVEGEEKFYIELTENEVSPQKFSIGKNVETGSNAKLVTVDDTTIEDQEADQSYVDSRNISITFITKENKFTGEVMKARMEENECMMYISGGNLDINAFTPNKTFKFIFDETTKQDRYGGMVFRLAYVCHHVRLESENYMTSTHRVILKRTSG